MKNKFLVIIIITLVLVTGCTKSNKKFYLENKYYGNSDFIKTTAKEINKLQDKKESFLVFTYNNYCTMEIPCDSVFEKFMKEYNVSIYSLPVEEMKKSFIYKTVKYAPSVIIVNKGKIVTYLDANKDEDTDLYQDPAKFKEWLEKYIYLKK